MAEANKAFAHFKWWSKGIINLDVKKSWNK
jgi:hypothetical protein